MLPEKISFNGFHTIREAICMHTYQFVFIKGFLYLVNMGKVVFDNNDIGIPLARYTCKGIA